MKKFYTVILISILILGCVSCKGKEKDNDNDGDSFVYVSEEPDTVSDTADESELTNEEDDTILLKEPPALIVESGGKSYDALRGSYSWHYPNGDGTNTGLEADSPHPLECKDLLHLLETAETTATLRFREEPNAILNVRCWSDEHWSEPTDDSEAVAVTGNEIELKPGGYIYEVMAKWDTESDCGGTAYYSFYMKTAENSSVLHNPTQPYAKYAEVLEQILTERSDPNGRTYEDVDDGVKFENNCFAIADIDGDGRDELIFNFNESYMAGMCEVVYDYDEETDTLREELIAWVDNNYYSNGLVQTMASHNHGYDPESRGTWPYLLYEYNEADDSYQSRYYVDSWDGLVFSEGYLGEVFPSELDTDGDGLLFYIEDELSGTEREYMDREEYEQWAEKMIPEENKIELTYYPMTEAEIENLKNAADK